MFLLDITLDMEINSRKTSLLKDPKPGEYMELDVWFPDHKLGFELQVRKELLSLISFLFSFLLPILKENRKRKRKEKIRDNKIRENE